MDETIAESHDMMSACIRYIKEENIPADLAGELKNFFSMDVIQKGSLSLADQNLVYRSLPLSLQVQVSLPRESATGSVSSGTIILAWFVLICVSLNLNEQLSRHISRDLITSVEMFQKTSNHFMDAISTLLQVDVISPGEYIFKAGTVCRNLYIIVSGAAETVKLDPQTQQWVVSYY